MRNLGIFGSFAASSLLLSTLFSAPSAFAKQTYFNSLLSAYPGSKLSTTTKCMTCHDGKKLNYFGQDFHKLVLRAPERPMNFRVLDALDSDGDGMSNINEINSARNPGVKD